MKRAMESRQPGGTRFSPANSEGGAMQNLKKPRPMTSQLVPAGAPL